MKHVFTFLIVSLFMLSACSSDDDVKAIPKMDDYIVFGFLYEECIGDCRELYLLTDSGLFEDANNPQNEEVVFNNMALADQEFKKAAVLFDVPENLTTNSFAVDAILQVIPDADYYIKGKKDGMVFELKYDKIDSTRAQELYNYHETLREVLLELL